MSPFLRDNIYEMTKLQLFPVIQHSPPYSPQNHALPNGRTHP